MRVVIAGGHGKIALIAERLLAQRGDSVAGLIRNSAHSADLEQRGRRGLGRRSREVHSRRGRGSSARS